MRQRIANKIACFSLLYYKNFHWNFLVSNISQAEIVVSVFSPPGFGSSSGFTLRLFCVDKTFNLLDKYKRSHVCFFCQNSCVINCKPFDCEWWQLSRDKVAVCAADGPCDTHCDLEPKTQLREDYAKLKVLTSDFIFKTLLRQYAKWVLIHGK